MHNNRRSTFEFFHWKRRDNAEIAPEKCDFHTKSAIYIAYCSKPASLVSPSVMTKSRGDYQGRVLSHVGWEADHSGWPATKRLIMAFAARGWNVGTSWPALLTVAKAKPLASPPYSVTYPTRPEGTGAAPSTAMEDIGATHGRQSLVTGKPSPARVVRMR